MKPVVMIYDAANRLQTRVIPAFTYAQRQAGIPTWRGTQLNNWYPAYAIPKDSQTFVYSLDGNLQEARNKYAQVFRSYSLNGRILAETLKVNKVELTRFRGRWS